MKFSISARATALVEAGLFSAVLVVALLPRPAIATGTSCAYVKSENTVQLTTVTPANARIFVTPKGEIKWSDTNSQMVFDCAAATVNNTNLVDIEDFADASSSTLHIIDLRRFFAPGTPEESAGLSEIEFTADGGSGDNNMLQIWGGGRKDRIVLGEEGINLNRDRDDDVKINNYAEVFVLGKGRRDVLSAGGGFGTGGPFLQAVTMYGNGGADLITGSPQGDHILGSKGPDEVNASAGPDIVLGDAGEDLLRGGPGGDELDGLGNDDRLRGQGGNDDLEGGPGVDDCRGGGGTNTISSCEGP